MLEVPMRSRADELHALVVDAPHTTIQERTAGARAGNTEYARLRVEKY